MPPAPTLRVTTAGDGPVRPDGDHVLYWMISARRTHWNFGLQRAAAWARSLNKPLLVLEALRADHRWAGARPHRFVVEGMVDNARRCEAAGVSYHAYVEPSPGQGSGLLEAAAEDACVVVTDEFPCFFLPSMVRAAAKRLPALLEQVDGNGVLPLRATDREFKTAHSFRRFLQGALPAFLLDPPDEDPLADLPGHAETPDRLRRTWPSLAPALARHGASAADALLTRRGPSVAEQPPGGPVAAGERLADFVDRLDAYAKHRNHPDEDAGSGLSPYLHFGHVGAAQVVSAVLRRARWSPDSLSDKRDGGRTGWWGLGPDAEAFLDQAVTWRELSYQFAHRHPDTHPTYASLPPWARATLAEHANDPRPHLYTLEELGEGRTHDPLWNAAQRQLRQEGRIHNYLRMLWGKKILHWSPSPESAFERMVELNNLWALDGRDPCSYAGIGWVLGRFDRAWGPERPVFGKVRYMTSASAARKLRLRRYVARHSPGSAP